MDDDVLRVYYDALRGAVEATFDERLPPSPVFRRRRCETWFNNSAEAIEVRCMVRYGCFKDVWLGAFCLCEAGDAGQLGAWLGNLRSWCDKHALISGIPHHALYLHQVALDWFAFGCDEAVSRLT